MVHAHRIAVVAGAAALALVAPACTTQQAEPVTIQVQPGETGARLYDGLDVFGRPISTSSREAQRWFDQGLTLAFGFNHAEAARAFREAAAHDPQSPMPWWGLAYVQGMNINDHEVTEDRWRTAAAAVAEARERLDNATPLERALVEAVARRAAWPAPSEQRPYDEAYADAMQRVYERFPDDPDVAVLYAESLMNLQPWDYWTSAGEPKGRIEEAIAALEHAMEIDPDHPGATHFYIHAVEASQDPDRALAAADSLAVRVPGAGHLVHMPSHIYLRVGDYARAADANVRAVAADRRLFSESPQPELYWLYYLHNLHFLAYSSMMEGRYEPAIQAARDIEADLPEQVVRDFAGIMEGLMPTTYHVMVRFGKWEDILQEPEPRGDHRLVSRAVHHYARGVALSALGRTDEARREIELFERAVELVPEDWYIMNNQMHQVLPIARGMLAGELLFREGRRDEAFAELRKAIEAEDELIYDEPPGWMMHVRHALGALLMSAGRFEQAEEVYREDLRRHRDNGWSLVGLHKSLEAQGRRDEAQQLASQVERAWARAAWKPTSSCLCEPGA